MLKFAGQVKRHKGIRKIIALILLLPILMVTCFICITDDSDAATSGSCGANITWNLSAGTLTLTGSGDMSNYQVYYWGPAPWYDNKESITRVVVGDGITSIGNWAFARCNNLSDVSLPDSVTSIGERAFLGCSSLESITLPSNLEYLKDDVFTFCESLSSINIPASVKSIGRVALTNGNTSLTGITVDPSNPNYSSEDGVLFDKEKKTLVAYPVGKAGSSYTVPSTVERIADWAFIYATLTSLVLSDNVVYIGFESIAYLYSLESLTFGKNLSYISQGAFNDSTLDTVTNRSSLTADYIGHYIQNVEIEGSVQTIDVGCLSVQYNTGTHVYSVNGFVGSPTSVEIDSIEIESTQYDLVSVRDNAFENCTTMTSLTISDDIKYIGPSSFKGCTGLTSLTIPVSLNSVSSNENPAFSGTNGIESVRFTPGTGYCYKYDYSSETKYDNCFQFTPWYYSRENLTSVTMDNGVKSIGNRMFYECSQLSEITLSNTLESIGFDAFYHSGITNITMPNSLVILSGYSFRESTQLVSVSISTGVTAIENNTFDGCTNLRNVTIPNGVVTIGQYAFNNCSSLISVSIPDTVTSIGYAAFTGCTSIKTVAIGSGFTEIEGWFYGLPVEEVTLSEGVLRISDFGFSNCSRLTTINLPNSLESIGSYAFSGCSSLTDLDFPENLSSIGVGCFGNCTGLTEIVLGDSVTSIGSGAFSGCTALESVTLGDGITVINSWFAGLPELREVNMGDSVVTISQNAFKNCSSLVSLTMPNTVATIGDYAFYGCSSLQSIVLSEILVTIETNVFVGCSSLTGITIPDSVTTLRCSFTTCTSLRTVVIGGGIGTVNQAFRGIASIETLTLREGITAIGNQAFMGCSGITTVSLPSTLTSIGSGAFSGCTSLISILIPNGVTAISSETFKSCTHLREITLSENLETIGLEAFSGCAALTEIDLPDSLTTVGSLAFYGCTSLQELVLPDGLVTVGASILGGNQRIEGIVIPNTVTSMDMRVFEGMTGLKNVTLGNGISVIDRWLYGITSLETVTLTEGITQIGYNAFRGCTNLGSIVIPNGVTLIGSYSFAGCTSLTTISLPGTLTTINAHAFDGCESLTAVTIPDSVTFIGNGAFDGCVSIRNLVIGSGITTVGNWFRGNTSLVSVTLNDGIQNLGDNAFNGCTGIVTITIPASVVNISVTVFLGCSSLTAINVPEGNETFSSIDGILFSKDQTRLLVVPGGFTGKYTIPNGVVSVETNAFYGVSGLTEVVIPDSVTTIASNAFSGCSGIVKVTIGSGIETVGTWFRNLTGLREVHFSSGLKTISENAFYGCISLVAVDIPDTVTTIGAGSFYGCYSLVHVHLGSSVTFIGGSAFYDCARLVEIVNDSSLTIVKDGSNGSIGYAALSIIDSSTPSAITYSGDFVFFTYKDVKYLIEYIGSEANITLPSGEQHYSIYGKAFYRNGTIQTVVISSAVESISTASFYLCSNLRTVTIGENVEKIGQDAFISCSALETIRILSTNNDFSRIVSSCESFREYVVENGNTSLKTVDGVLFNAGMTELLSYPSGKTGTSYTVPDTVQSIAGYAFNYCVNLQTLSIPDSVTEMENYCIDNCYNLTVIHIGDGVIRLQNYVFRNCDGLVTLHIGASLKTIDSDLFNGGPLSHLREIIVSENNPYFTSDGGVLFSKDKTVLVRFPAYKTTGAYTIPAGTKIIGSSAFRGSRISAITISDSVTEIEMAAFYACSSLSSIYLGKSVVTIGQNAFNYCSSISHIDNRSLLKLESGSTGYGYIAYYVGNFDNNLRTYTTDTGLSVTYNDLSDICKVTGYSGTGSDLVLDNVTVNSKTVRIVEIAPSAFKSNTVIRSVETGPSVVRIGASSFERCTNLVTIILSVNLTVIGDNAFDGCVSITSVTIPDGLESLGSYSFRGCTGLTDLTVPISLDVVTGSTPGGSSPPFWNCSSIQQVTFTSGTGDSIDYPNYNSQYSTPWAISNGTLTKVTFDEGITHIGSYLLYGCSKITAITLPSTLMTMDPTAFVKCFGLKSFSISGTNEHFCTVDGVLFSKDMSVLVMYPSDRDETTYGVPAGVTVIGSYAFCPVKLESLYLGDSVTTINDHAITTRGMLKEIIFGASLTTVGGHAFDGIQLYDSDCRTGIDIGKIAGQSFSLVSNGFARVCTVTLMTDGGTEMQPIKVAPGQTVKFGSEPSKEGKYFSGWFLDEQYSKKFELSTRLYEDISLYAKWTESDLDIGSGENVVQTVDGNSATISAEDAELIRYRMETGSTSSFDLKFQSGVVIGMDKEIFGIMSDSTISASEVQIADDGSDSSSSLAGRPAFEIETSGTKDFGTNQVRIMLPYQLRSNEKPNNLVIYYVENNTIKEKLNCEYESGQVVFMTNHLSTYVIGYEGSNETNGTMMLIIIAGGASAVGLLAIAGIVFFIMRRKDH